MKRRRLLTKGLPLVLVFVLGMSLFTGCGSAEPMDRVTDEAPVEAVEEAAVESEPADFSEEESWELSWDDEDSMERTERIVSEDFTPGEITGESEGNMGPIPILLASETGRQLVYNTDIIIETTEFMAGQRQLLDEVTRLNGQSERTTVNGRHILTPYVERDASFNLRLPPENLIELIIFIEDNFQLVYLDKKMIDLTIAYERNLSHLDDLRERENRLLENLDDEDSPRDPVDIEQELENIQRDIRNIEEATTQVDRDVIYSSLNIRLFEVILPEEIPPEEPEDPPTFGERLQETSGDSLIRLLTMLQGFLIFLIAALPVLLPLTAIGLIALFIYKKTNKEKRTHPPVANYPVNTPGAPTPPAPPNGVKDTQNNGR